MRRRSRTDVALAAWLLHISCASSPTTMGVAGAALAMTPPILRIELENYDQMQFFGKVSVGSPVQEFRVIFDTGSSDVWLADQHCHSCAAFARRYVASKSSTFAPLADAFRLEYGSGVAAGMLMRETLRLGGALEIAHVQMGRVNTTTERLQSFHADGIVGLGLESLAAVTKPGLFAGESTLLSTFSIYINPLPSSLPPSQLILGGADPAIAALVTGDTQPQWHHFPLIPFPDKKRLGFWAIRMQDMTISALSDTTRNVTAQSISQNAIVIVDSGTSLILLPPRIFNATIDAIATHLRHAYDDVELTANSAAISGFACKGCAPRMFPPLAFTFDTTTFHLTGEDYARCDGAFCSPQLDSHTLFRRQPSHSPHGDEVIVLGAVFLRAYYTVFDAPHARVGFACASTGCRGGRLPELRFPGGIFGGRSVLSRFGRDVSLAVAILLFAVAMALLWQLLHAPPSPLCYQTSRRKSPNGDAPQESESPEDEPSPWSIAPAHTKDSIPLASRVRQGSSFGMELLRRLASHLTIAVVVTSGSDSEEPDQDATLRGNKAALAMGPAEKPERSGDDDDWAFPEQRVERMVTADPESVGESNTPRFRKGSVCLDA